eukprot:gene7405-11728_t
MTTENLQVRVKEEVTEGELNDFEIKIENSEENENMEDENEYEETRKKILKETNKCSIKSLVKKKKRKKTLQRKSRRLSGETLTDESTDEERNDTVTFERRKRNIGKGKPRGSKETGPNVMRKVAGKIYDSTNGKTCHQELYVICLKNRYGEELETVLEDPNWVCPYCRNLCNCSFCMEQPTGQLIQIARANGYSSVCHMMVVNGLHEPRVKSEPKSDEEDVFEGLVEKEKITKKTKVQKVTAKESKSKKSKTEEIAVQTENQKEKEENNDLTEDEEDEEEVYVVEAILKHRKNKKTKETEFLIKWEGWSNDWNEWIPESQCSCDSLIKKYWKTPVE